MKPRQVQAEHPAAISFDGMETTGKCYVYGYGRLQRICEKAGEAVRMAKECEGVAVAADQSYLWESGNRDLRYAIKGKEEQIHKIQSQLAAGTAPMEIIEEIRDGQAQDLTRLQLRRSSVYHQSGPPRDRHEECTRRNDPGGIPE